MSAFYPGALAVIKKASIPENIGRAATLVSATNERFIHIPDTHLVVENPSLWKCWIVEGEFVTKDFFGLDHTVSIAVAPEAWLMPLGGYTPSEQETRVLELTT